MCLIVSRESEEEEEDPPPTVCCCLDEEWVEEQPFLLFGVASSLVTVLCTTGLTPSALANGFLEIVRSTSFDYCTTVMLWCLEVIVASGLSRTWFRGASLYAILVYAMVVAAGATLSVATLLTQLLLFLGAAGALVLCCAAAEIAEHPLCFLVGASLVMVFAYSTGMFETLLPFLFGCGGILLLWAMINLVFIVMVFILLHEQQKKRIACKLSTKEVLSLTDIEYARYIDSLRGIVGKPRGLFGVKELVFGDRGHRKASSRTLADALRKRQYPTKPGERGKFIGRGDTVSVRGQECYVHKVKANGRYDLKPWGGGKILYGIALADIHVPGGRHELL